MDYILRGDSKEVAKVLQENRIRVERGVIEFTPVQPDAALDADCIETIKESHAAIAADCQRMTVAQHELAEIIREIVPSAPEPMEDNKNVEVEDMTEVNLDDVKDIPEEDSKPEPASTPKKSRSKKSE